MDVYWKIMATKEGLKAICLQDFDEKDYDQTKFLSQYKFQSEEDAQGFIQDIHAYIGRNMALGFR